MKRLFVIPQLTAWIGIVLSGTACALAQDVEMVRHLDYDQKAPLEMKQIGAEQREHATIYDITYASPKVALCLLSSSCPKGKGLSPL